jgi:nicotinate-nucleotide adenylyltransferase
VKARRKVGLFGGSFDPIHTGHLILAQSAMNFIGLKRVYFVPTAAPPHKETADLTDFETRRRMVELAIEDNPGFELSLVEAGERISYTYESVLYFKEKGLDKEQIHLLIGSDSLEEVVNWRKPEEIFANATVVALRRPGYDDMPELPRGAAVIMIEAGSNSISSSEIRELLREGKSVRYLVPPPVERFISEHSLYRATT